MVPRSQCISREEEHRLIRRWQTRRDRAAFDKVVLANMWLVKRVADDFKRRRQPLDDLIQEGAIGLMRAVDKFDRKRCDKLWMFARYFVYDRIFNYVHRNKIGPVTLSRTATKAVRAMYSVAREAAAVQAATGLTGDGLETEVAKRKGLTVSRVRDALAAASASSVSLSGPVHWDGDTSKADALPYLGASPEDAAIQRQLASLARKALAARIGKLSQKQRAVATKLHLAARQGTYSSVGKELGMSRQLTRLYDVALMRKVRMDLDSKAERVVT